VTNQGTADYYSFFGAASTDDHLYSIRSIYDDAAGTIAFESAGVLDNGLYSSGRGDTDAPQLTISTDNTHIEVGLVAHGGSNNSPISGGDSFPQGTKDYIDAAGVNGMSGSESVWGYANFDAADHPTGNYQWLHNDVSTDATGDGYAVAYATTPASGSESLMSGSHRGVMRGTGRGIG
jgi:hypothetical protein